MSDLSDKKTKNYIFSFIKRKKKRILIRITIQFFVKMKNISITYNIAKM